MFLFRGEKVVLESTHRWSWLASQKMEALMDFVACLSSYFLRLCQCLVMLHGSRANMIFMENKEIIFKHCRSDWFYWRNHPIIYWMLCFYDWFLQVRWAWSTYSSFIIWIMEKVLVSLYKSHQCFCSSHWIYLAYFH